MCPHRNTASCSLPFAPPPVHATTRRTTPHGGSLHSRPYQCLPVCLVDEEQYLTRSVPRSRTNRAPRGLYGHAWREDTAPALSEGLAHNPRENTFSGSIRPTVLFNVGVAPFWLNTFMTGLRSGYFRMIASLIGVLRAINSAYMECWVGLAEQSSSKSCLNKDSGLLTPHRGDA